ncbi:MFS transporter [Lapillicoccus jejuensis]|uniref:Putative MFS family arabinose efflux permease n=1 Tax=Lapillicoccus jejuensis TaxID=402171 RepID=A0A542DZQ6_9MICO|nr:MFS transporter [Lapillicoccus jejuensis]TQJ08568.1 putative MFS family arabinose efflux permease [Lapillicoccus jejuensis]
MGPHRELHRHHDVTVLMAAQTVSELGTQAGLFVLPLITYALTGSTVLAGLAGAANLLGTALAALPGGVLADRVDRRRLMRTSSALGALSSTSVVVAALLGALTVPHLLAAAFVTGGCAGLFAPAEISALRAVVPPHLLPTAIGQQVGRQRVADLVGAPLGGLLLGLARWAPYVLDAVAYAVAWVTLGRLQTDLSPSATRRRGTARADIAEGLRFVWSRPLFRTLMVWSMGSNLVVNALFTAANLRLVRDGYPAWQIGLVDASAGVCGVLGALAAPYVVERFPTGRLTVLVAWSFVPLTLPLVVLDDPVAVAVALSLGVFLNPAGNGGMGAYKVAVTPAELVGRVQSVGQLMAWSTIPLAPVVAGVLLSTVGGAWAVGVLVGLGALVALLPTLVRSVRLVPRPSEWREQCRTSEADWPGAGGGQRVAPRPQARPSPVGPDRRALEPAGAAARHP